MSAEAELIDDLQQRSVSPLAVFLLPTLGMKNILGLTGLGIAVAGMVEFQPGSEPLIDRVLQPYVICGALAFIFHLGMSWQTFMDHKRRLLALEAERITKDTIAEMNRRIASIEARCDAVLLNSGAHHK